MQIYEEPKIERKKILVAVKTYPCVSSKYSETVCTAGLLTNGKWIRVYPIPYRSLSKDKKFKKYQWIDVEVVRDNNDPRPESYKLAGDIKLLDCLDTKESWEERKKFVLGKIYNNLDTLISEARDVKISTSLATFKPKRIINFSVETKSYQEQKKRAIESIPFKFYYTFIDQKGKKSKLQILDWEIHQLCRKFMRIYGENRKKIVSLLREKYLDKITKNCDVYLLLGTSKYWHIRRSSNPFMIIGIFYPKKLVITMIQGCDKTIATCANQYNNVMNFRGEPHVPGLDKMLETAGTR